MISQVDSHTNMKTKSKSSVKGRKLVEIKTVKGWGVFTENKLQVVYPFNPKLQDSMYTILPVSISYKVEKSNKKVKNTK